MQLRSVRIAGTGDPEQMKAEVQRQVVEARGADGMCRARDRIPPLYI